MKIPENPENPESSSRILPLILPILKFIRGLLILLITLILSIPTLLVYVPFKLLYEKGLQKSRKSKIVEFRARRAAGFHQFNNRILISELSKHDLFMGNGGKEEIERIMKEIVEMDMMALRDALQSGRYNAYTVLCSYVWRGLKVNRKLNCITEVINEAFEEAERMDRGGLPKGPLYGIPFSVKSNFYVQNYDSTTGLSSFLGSPAPRTCALVDHLRSLGAIPFCLTNVPQGLLSYITSNPLYGTTINPWDFTRTPGGSSGGEAALVAAGGAPFGIGNDLVGSLRIPAAFCGLVTLKPTQDRIHEVWMNPGFEGRGRLGMSSGFFTRTVEEQYFLLDQVIGNEEFRKKSAQSSKGKLQDPPNSKPVIGWFVEDGFNPVAPSNVRAVKETIEKLAELGYETRQFRLEDVDSERFSPFQVAQMLFRNVMADNGAYMSSLYAGEPYDKHMSRFIRLVRYKQNPLVRWFLTYVALPLAPFTPFGSSRLSCLGYSFNDGVTGVRENQERTDRFREAWTRYWKGLGIDVLICPSFTTPAQPFAYPSQLSTGVFITGLFNLLDSPTGIVPTSPVKEGENDVFNSANDYILRLQKEAIQKTSGLPNAVQVVALPNDEEICLEVMKVIERIYSNSTDKPLKLRWKGDNQDDVFAVGDTFACFERY